MISDDDPRVAGRTSQSPPFDRREMLADAVEFVDRRPAGHQQPGDGQLVGQGQPGAGAGNSALAPPEIRHEAQIVSRKLTHAVQNLFRAGDALGRRFVHTGRSGCVQMDAGERPHTVGRHVDPAAQPLGQRRSGQGRFQSGRHAGPRLAGADSDDSAFGAQRENGWPQISSASFGRHAGRPRTSRSESTASTPALPDGQRVVSQSCCRPQACRHELRPRCPLTLPHASRHYAGANARSGRVLWSKQEAETVGAEQSESLEAVRSGARTQPREAGDHFVEVARNANLVILEVAEPGAVPTDGFDQRSRDLRQSAC